MQSPSRNSRRSLDLGRRRAFRTRRRHADRRRTATAVVVSRRRRGASQHCRGRAWPPRRSGNCAAGNRRTSRSICGMPSSNAAASVICASTASRRRRPGTRSPGSTRPAIGASCGCTPISASPRRRLQGSELQAGARRGSGRADAVGRRGVRDRGLCRRRRGRADALA